MDIHIGSGVGSGPTTMAAFDSALNAIGIANYNMIRLSSIVPPSSQVIVHDGKITIPIPGTWGDRLYVVMAEIRVYKPNADAWAGIGWVRDKKTGRGLFTEHEGGSEAFVRREITHTLEALMETRSAEDEFDWSQIEMKVIGGTCNDKPICAMVAAVFQISDWENGALRFKIETPESSSKKLKFWRTFLG